MAAHQRYGVLIDCHMKVSMTVVAHRILIPLQVYRAVVKHSGEEIAVKLIDLEALADNMVREMVPAYKAACIETSMVRGTLN